MSLSEESSVKALLSRTNVFTPSQKKALETYLDGLTVNDLLQTFYTAQDLANELEKAAREEYAERPAPGTSNPTPYDNVGDYLRRGARIPLSQMGEVAFKLLRYVHQMFDPLHTVLYHIR